jgi:hypothetical protein
LTEDLGPGPTALDTAAFIYYIEENEAFLPLVAPIFEDVAGGRRQIVTSSLTLLEVLVVPYRTGNLPGGSARPAFPKPRVRLLDIGREHLRIAAQLRALNPAVRTPDALHPLRPVGGCTAFAPRPDRLVPGLKVVQLRSYLPA